ncbi:hypothetical protein BVG01_18585 [Bacillus anthracis]|nr:hypothetical protein BVG01_18585 [Bacillus anthracis]
MSYLKINKIVIFLEEYTVNSEVNSAGFDQELDTYYKGTFFRLRINTHKLTNVSLKNDGFSN